MTVTIRNPEEFLRTLTPLEHPTPPLETTSGPGKTGYVSIAAYATLHTLDELDAWTDHAHVNLYQLGALRVSVLRSISNPHLRQRLAPPEAAQLQQARRSIDRHLNITSATGETYQQRRSLSPIPLPGLRGGPAGTVMQTWADIASIKLTPQMTQPERRDLHRRLLTYIHSALLTEVHAAPTEAQRLTIQRATVLSAAISSTISNRRLDMQDVTDHDLRQVVLRAFDQHLNALRAPHD